MNPITPWLSKNWKARLKPLLNPKKPMPMTTNEPNTHKHVPCIPNQLGNHTCNWLPASILIEATWSSSSVLVLCFAFPFLYLLSCFLLLMLFLSLKPIQKLNWKKVVNWSSEAFFIIDASNFFISLYFPSISSSHETCDLSPSFYLNFLCFHK